MAGKIFALRTPLIIFIAFLFLSCDDAPKKDTGNFWAKNISTDKNYKLKAEIFAEGKHCKVWVESGSGVSKAQANDIANKYDAIIYGHMINTFGIKNPSYNDKTFSNIMEFADYLGDKDGKLCILLLDIKDNYKAGENESYVAGYFSPGNFYSSAETNKRDMIYIDTYPGMKAENIENVYTTLAHEMQHMMNFVTRVIKKSNNLMDTWIDEGLSSAAEYIVSDGKHSIDRIDWYNENGDSNKKLKGLIDQGNNFFVWDNRMEENNYAILDDYATVYLFFQWLRLQKGIGVYRDIISSNYCDYQAIEDATDEKWDALLRNWMAANYINDSDGEYGYKGNISITAHTAPANKTISLYPGEGVYSLTDENDIMPFQDINVNINIKYAGLDKAATAVNDDIVFAAGALLTYNINTTLGDKAEEGITTGKAASVNMAPMGGRSAVSSYSGPYRIGAGDILSRNGKKRNFTSWDIQDK